MKCYELMKLSVDEWRESCEPCSFERDVKLDWLKHNINNILWQYKILLDTLKWEDFNAYHISPTSIWCHNCQDYTSPLPLGHSIAWWYPIDNYHYDSESENFSSDTDTSDSFLL